jgi:hypothetical protein
LKTRKREEGEKRLKRLLPVPETQTSSVAGSWRGQIQGLLGKKGERKMHHLDTGEHLRKYSGEGTGKIGPFLYTIPNLPCDLWHVPSIIIEFKFP